MSQTFNHLIRRKPGISAIKRLGHTECVRPVRSLYKIQYADAVSCYKAAHGMKYYDCNFRVGYFDINLSFFSKNGVNL